LKLALYSYEDPSHPGRYHGVKALGAGIFALEVVSICSKEAGHYHRIRVGKYIELRVPTCEDCIRILESMYIVVTEETHEDGISVRFSKIELD